MCYTLAFVISCLPQNEHTVSNKDPDVHTMTTQSANNRQYLPKHCSGKDDPSFTVSEAPLHGVHALLQSVSASSSVLNEFKGHAMHVVLSECGCSPAPHGSIKTCEQFRSDNSTGALLQYMPFTRIDSQIKSYHTYSLCTVMCKL